MLTIQRASAGSGKTFTLAKQFILNLIAYKTPSGKWLLRNERQMEDAIQHILAITFTNKATNEMKQRIIKNLSLLSLAGNISDSKKKIKSIPYLEEFQNLTGADYKEIAAAAQKALRVILNNFSLFRISTIDSFFQEILRTFTYEANINDSYKLEIDSKFIIDSAIDAAINALDTTPAEMGNASFWLREIMSLASKKTQLWNPFTKRASSKSLYAKIRRALTQLEKEEFKNIKDSIDSHFSSPEEVSRFLDFYRNLKKHALQERTEALREIQEKVDTISAIILENNLSGEQLSNTFLNHLPKIKALKPEDSFDYSFNKILADGSVLKKKFRTPDNPIDFEALSLYELISLWNNPDKDSYYKNWLVYGDLLPYFGIILEVRAFLADVLETNNLIQLSDTGYILKKIIGDEEAPFVFERMGNRIDHYLIDEFQDTSRMQWDVIYPLLNEGVAKNKDSLIIGDPKQSIYRFRNADHHLITDVVPAAFPGYRPAGYTIEENTNWRSKSNIIRFNNFFFATLSGIMKGKSIDAGNSYDFSQLYSNVMQHPHDKSGKGYVEVRVFDKNDSSEDIDDKALAVGPLVSELVGRGYRLKDIGILVNTNDKGKEVVDALLQYNASLTSEQTKIDFISEESLLISSSSAVDVIISVIEKLASPGSFVPVTEDSENEKPVYINWENVKLNFNIFSQSHKDGSPAENLIEFLSTGDLDFSLESLIESLPSPSIASITEAVVETFLPDDLKSQQAIYIASFQDIVNEYVAGHHDDPASFLEWWYARGNQLSVAAPEGIDAVQIMTIHKSKGLEFKCVIIPFATDSFKPSHLKEEWRWVSPNNLPGLDMPPVLPVNTGVELLGSIHENIYKDYYDQVITDKLNMYYVAFTRAINELYIFTTPPKKTPEGIYDFLDLILKGKAPAMFETDAGLTITPEDIDVDDEKAILSFGSPLTPEEIKAEYADETMKNASLNHYIDTYKVNKNRPRLRSLATKVTPSGFFDNA